MTLSADERLEQERRDWANRQRRIPWWRRLLAWLDRKAG